MCIFSKSSRVSSGEDVSEDEDGDEEVEDDDDDTVVDEAVDVCEEDFLLVVLEVVEVDGLEDAFVPVVVEDAGREGREMLLMVKVAPRSLKGRGRSGGSATSLTSLREEDEEDGDDAFGMEV